MNLFKQTAVTRTTITREYNREQLIQLLFPNGMEHIETSSIEIMVPIPGGGDYSNMDLEIDDRSPLTVRFTTVREEI